MGFFSDLFKRFEVEDEEETLEKNNRSDNRDRSEANALTLYSISGREITTLSPYTQVLFLDSKEKKTVSIFYRDGEDGDVHTLLSCQTPESAKDKMELINMMRTLSEDIARARRNGVESIKVPINRYDLYAYIRNRPSIDLDLNKLESCLGTQRHYPIFDDFNHDIKTGKRVDIYTADNSVYNMEAIKILTAAYSRYQNVHFYELSNKTNGYVSWNHDMIVRVIKANPDAVIIGVGINGKKPNHCVSIMGDAHCSVIAKVSFLVGHFMNTREQMLNAQFNEHANGVLRIGKEKAMEEKVVDRAMMELAMEEARYRLPEGGIQKFVESVQKARQENAHSAEIHVPFHDSSLVMNLLPETRTGILVNVNMKKLYYYGNQEIINLLNSSYQWAIENPNTASVIVAPKQPVAYYEQQVEEITVRRKYIKEMNETLQENQKRSISASYQAISALARTYNRLGFSLEDQVNMLQHVPQLDNSDEMDSIVNILRECLSDEIPYQSFDDSYQRTSKNYDI